MEDHTPLVSNLGWPAWAKDAVIYEINVRQFTPEGSFEAFRKHLPRLRTMGVDILWFMPIFPISQVKRKGSLGSYYAVANYREINPEFGTMDDFTKIVSDAHTLGMKVVLDWVPNHTGWDHDWITDHPEYYTKDGNGQITDPVDANGNSMGWADVADLDYGCMELREAMISEMIFWLRDHHIDGFRQDMALLVPIDFWQEAAEKLKSVKPDIFLLAESEDIAHLNHRCFNSMYSWALHHILTDIAQGKSNVGAIDHWYVHEKSKVQSGAYMFFTSNHDENSWSGSEVERMGEAHRAFAVLVSTLDGIPLIYNGQEEPMPKRLAFFEKDDIGFKDYLYSDFYTILNTTKHHNPALWNADFGGTLVRILPSEHIFAFERAKAGNKVTVIINLSRQNQSIQFDRTIVGNEVFSGRSVNFSIGEELRLMPWEFRVITSQ